MKKLILVIGGALFVNAVCAQRFDMGSSFNYAKAYRRHGSQH
jgi:hypothetical protein